MKNMKIQKLKEKLSPGPIQRGILISTMGGTLLVCIIIIGISFFIFNSYLRFQMIHTTEYSLLNLSANINAEVSNAYRLIRYAQVSNDICNYLENATYSNTPLRVRTYDRLNEEYQSNESNKYIPRMMVASDNDFIHICQTPFSTTAHFGDIIPEMPYYEQLLTAEDYDYSFGFVPDPCREAEEYAIPIIRPISKQFRSAQIGYVYLELSSSLFTDKLTNYYKEEGSDIYLVLGEHIYQLTPSSVTEIYEKPAAHLVKTEAVSSGASVYDIDSPDSPMTVIAIELNMDGCYIVQSIPSDAINSQRQIFILLVIIILSSVIALGLTLLLFLNRQVHRPLVMLKNKIEKTSAGDFSRDESIEWDHELGDIGKGINSLSENINGLLDNLLTEEKKKRDLEYQMLQSQINPHFIYNTLNSIKIMAMAQHANGISEMTTALATLLRSISKGTKLIVPISEELELIKNYFTIQNYRYGGMISLDINNDDDAILQANIIKFTLQPLVENAIFHGLEPKGGTGNITIHLYYNEHSDICIDVTDDGIGIPQDRIQEIMLPHQGGKTEFFREIGIYNVNKRLQYEFGEEYGISIFSEPGKFTTMRITIPTNRINEA